MKLLVGNLTHGITASALAAKFEQHGLVESVALAPGLIDAKTWPGFAHVDMPDASQARAAVEGLRHREHEGRRLRVEYTEPVEWE